MLKPRRMDPTEVFTGSKGRTSKKTEASREKSGPTQAGILATGETTARKGLASNSTRMGTNTKECGLWTKSMAKELTGDLMETNSEENTLATGSRTKNMEEEPFSSKTAIVTTATGSMECLKVKEE